MTQAENPARPTPTRTLWIVGVLGGLAVAVLMFMTGGDDAQHTARNATQVGAWSLRALLVGMLLLGGWAALRRGKR